MAEKFVFEYTLKRPTGETVTLNETDMMLVHRRYEVLCTAEYMLELLDNLLDTDVAIRLATEVRRRMDKYGGEEQDVLLDVLDDEYGTDDIEEVKRSINMLQMER